MTSTFVQVPASSRGRIVAVDIARAVALVGMILAHLYSPRGLVGEITSGFPSTLFAVLSGVSLAIMANSAQEKNIPVSVFRYRSIVRGILLLFIGTVIEPFSGGIDIVLFSIGAVYIVLPYTLGLSSRALLGLTLLLAVLSAASNLLLSSYIIPYEDLGGSYPPLAWATYALVGVLFYRRFIARKELERRDYLCLCLLIAVSLAITLWGINQRNWTPYGMPYWVIQALNFEAHTGSLGDIIVTLAGSLCVLATFLLLFRLRPLALLFFPLQALGSMSLTVYIAHILSAGALISSSFLNRYEQATWATLVFSLLLATIIKCFFSQGPAEYLMAQAVKKLTSTTPRKQEQ